MLRPFGAVPLSVPETLGRYCQKAWGAGDKNKSCLLHTAMTGRVDTERCTHSPRLTLRNASASSDPGLGIQGYVKYRAWL